MSKQTIYVRHKDELIEELLRKHKVAFKLSHSKDKILKEYGGQYQEGYIDALEWALGLDKTREGEVK